MGKIGKLFKRANELREDYQDARDVEFSILLGDFLKDFTTDKHLGITEDDLQDFLTKFDQNYPDEASWSWDEANAELDKVGDQQMELARDREMGL